MKHLIKFNESQDRNLQEFTDYMNSVFVDFIDDGADITCELDDADNKFGCFVDIPLKLPNALVLDNILHKRVSIKEQIKANDYVIKNSNIIAEILNNVELAIEKAKIEYNINALVEISKLEISIFIQEN